MSQEDRSDAGFETFAEMTVPLQNDLKRYCLAKAGSAWDADDLLQESLLKAYRWHTRFPNREITKPFLFRIAANAWVDICRSRRSDSSRYITPFHMMNGAGGMCARRSSCCPIGSNRSKSF